jgi:outer membrane protein assembly factor BamB
MKLAATLPRVLACLVCSAALLAAGCRKPPPAPKPAGPLPVNSFQRVWAANLDAKAGALSELHVRDDVVYAYSESGRVSGLKREGGTLQFTYGIKGGKSSLRPPIVLKEHVVYPTATTLEVFMRDGRFVRSLQLPFAVRTNGDGAGTFVYIAGDYPLGGARVAKVDVTQEYVPVRWDFIGLDGGKSGFTAGVKVVEDAAYAAGLDGNVYAVAQGSREQIWPIPNGVFDTGGAIEADLVADATGVYVASTDGVLYALNPDNGKLRWQFFAGAPLREAPVVTSDRVYLKVPGKGLLAFHKNEGKDVREPLWTRADARQFLAQDDKHAYLRGKDNRIVAVDKTTGEPKFQSKRKDFRVFGVNTKDDGIVFAATKGGQVLAVRGVFKPGVIGEQVLNDDDAAGWEPVAVAMR